MRGVGSRVRKPLVTKLALEGFVSGVNPYMFLKHNMVNFRLNLSSDCDQGLLCRYLSVLR